MIIRCTIVPLIAMLALTAQPVTFNRDIAPIVFHSCAPCHRPGEAAPFPLLSFADAGAHARQIAKVTRSRYMPPWLPEPGKGEFAGESRLTDAQIKLIERWAGEGAPEGDPRDLPPRPTFTEGWQLGKPDLVVELEQAYTLPASGSDTFRNFVLHAPVTTTRYVRAVELRPGNKRVVHHANILIDRSGASRRRRSDDGQVGFPGMDLQIEVGDFDPDSHFLFWKPGTPPVAEPDDMSWRLDANTDLVVNMHLQPSGKPEQIRPSVGIYFSDKPATKFPMLLQLEHDGALDIPAGQRDFVIEDELKLPLDVDALAVYPHAHYLGKDLQAFAILPDGSRRWLIHINDWDINWQAVYRFKQPLFLPKGSTVRMRYTYDNSADNPRNPSRPPIRVVNGDRTIDEMGHLWLQVLPRPGQVAGDPRLALQEALMRRRLEKYPSDYLAEYSLGAVIMTRGDLPAAIERFRAALRARPNEPAAHNSLGAALLASGDNMGAIAEFRKALALRPDYTDAEYNLGQTLVAQGDYQDAIASFRRALRSNPSDSAAHMHLGLALQAAGDLASALQEFNDAVRLKPDLAEAQHALGCLLATQGNVAGALDHLRKSVDLEPNDADLRSDLGTALAQSGRFAEAKAEFEAAIRIDPNHEVAQKNLRLVRGLMGSAP
jgi:Flp pilus assembly protein TadD